MSNEPQVKLNWRTRLQAFRYLRPLFSIVWEASAVLTSAGIGSQLLRALLPVAALWIPKLILDDIIAYITRGSGDLRHIWYLIAAELAVAVLIDIMGRISALCDNLLNERVASLISIRVMSHANTLDLGVFEDPKFHDNLERARAWATFRRPPFTPAMAIGQELVTLLSLSVGLIVFSPWLVVLLIVSVLPTFAAEAHFTIVGYFMRHRRTARRRLLDYLCQLCSSLQSAKEVRMFGLGQFFTDRYSTISSEIYSENKRLATKHAIVGGSLNLISALAYYGAYIVVLLRTLSGAISIGTFSFLTGAFSRSRSGITNTLLQFNDFSQNAMELKELFDFLDAKPTIKSKPTALSIPRPIRKGFEFRQVSFSYPGSKRPVVQNLNFFLHAGEKIALIGVNGAGKTTIVKLLTRLYDPTAGQILLDGVDLREYSLADLRSHTSIIFQDYMRFDMLARENIGFGQIDSLFDQSRITHAAEQGLANRVVEKFSSGYDQMLGRRFEGGVDLSGGEWQKFALSRAYMRDSQCIILDEPTATLDAAAEHEVFERFARLTEGRMGLLISHRFSTVRIADRILVLEGGEIREEGNHQELMSLSGRYAGLFSLQAAGYK